jgi:hypothetical protein
MNEFQQLFISIFFILLALIFDVRVGLIFSCIIFGVFLILFINKKMSMKQEGRTVIEHFYEPTYLGKMNEINGMKEINGIKQQYQSIPKQCFPSDDCYKLYTDPNRVRPTIVKKDMLSKNNTLQGGQNPKTLIPPMVTRPAYDVTWRKDTMVVPNMIDGATNEPIQKSGYLTHEPKTTSIIQPRTILSAPHSSLYSTPTNSYSPLNLSLYHSLDSEGKPTPLQQEDILEPFDVNYNTATWNDSILAPNGYDAKQFEQSNYPGNLPMGNCARDPAFKEYNKALFSTPLQPGVTFTNQVAQPINSNMGISFQQQFLPRTYKEQKGGNLDIVDHDPNFAPPFEILEYPDGPKPENVYDPRFNGYGTSYRNYVDNVTGQPRFPYDDINAVRMPNYLVRSKIDNQPFAETYGPMQSSGQSLNEIRQKAQDVFIEDTTNFRNDMMSRLMRKRNAELWQTKQFPIRGAGRMMSGGRNGATANQINK